MANRSNQANILHSRLFAPRPFVPRVGRGVVSYPGVPPQASRAGAPMAAPNNLSLSQPHDWSGFDKAFHPIAATAANAGPQTFGRSTFAAAPEDINGPAVQGLLDRAAGVTSTKPTAAPNPGAIARATSRQVGTLYGTVGSGKAPAPADGTPIMENGKQIGIAGSPQQGPPTPTLAETRAMTLKRYPNIGVAGTPENAAFIAAYKQGGEAAAHAAVDDLMKPFTVGPAAPTPFEKSEMNYAQAKADKAKADAGPFTPGSTGGNVVSAIKNAPGIPESVGGLAESAGKKVGLNNESAKAVGEYARDVTSGLTQPVQSAGELAAQKVSSVLNPPISAPEDKTAGNQDFKAMRAAMRNNNTAGGSAAPGGNVGGSVGAAAPAPFVPKATAPVAINQPQELHEDEVPNLAGGGVVADPASKLRVPFTPSLDRLKTMQIASAVKAPLATASGTPGLTGMAAHPSVAPVKTPGLDRQVGMQTEAAAGAPLVTASATPGLDAMAKRTPNYASGFVPKDPTGMAAFTPGKSRGEMESDATFKSNMTLANQAARNNLVAAGFNDVGVTSQTRNGDPDNTVPGYNPDAGAWNGPKLDPVSGMPMGEEDTGKEPVPNYAGGRVTGYAKGKLFVPALRREKKAIARHVGGARPGDKPEPVMLAGRPAVINSGEKVVPTPAGPAVLNRMQQRRAKLFVPSRG